MNALKSLGQAFKVPEIRKKLIFTILMLVIFRLGCCIPVPNIDRAVLSDYFGNASGLFGLFDMFSGGSFSNFTIFALSITPYVTASIILQLLTVVIPRLEALSKEGTEGRKKIAQYTRYLTVVLALVQSVGLTVGLFRSAVVDKSVFSIAVVVITLTAGTAFLMWLGEQINEHGIGNGISLIIMAGIVARMPSAIYQTFIKLQEGTVSIISVVIFVIFAIAVVVGVIEVQQGTRKIPVQYAKRVVGRKMYGGQNTHIPLKVNQAGVIPVIFSLSILQFPLTVTYFTNSASGFTQFVTKYLSPSGSPGVWIYWPVLLVLIGQEAWAAYLSQEDSIRGRFPVLTSLASRNDIILPDDSVNLKTWMPVSYTHLDVYKRQRVLTGMRDVLKKVQPDIVLVHGLSLIHILKLLEYVERTMKFWI